MHTRKSDQDLESDQQMDCSHTSQLSIPSKIVLYGHLERKLFLNTERCSGIRDDGETTSFPILFGFSLIYFLGPMACWTTVLTVTQVQKA